MSEDDILVSLEEAFADFKAELATFLTSQQRNQYVYGHEIIAVYVRKNAIHMIQGVPLPCLDIASIVIAKYQHRGFGKRVVDYMHQINPYRITYIENILNDRFYDRLVANSWKDTGCLSDRCLFKSTPLTKSTN